MPTHPARAAERLRRALPVAIAAALLGGCHARRAPGPNDAYRDPRVSAEAWHHMFEDDGRGEIYQRRQRILELAAARPGMQVADIGAGTGLFSMMLSDVVGPGGRVYAEEVMEKFSRYIAERAERERRRNVVSVIGTEWGIGLPPASIDLAFVCDVYHHFDHPREMLASIHRALRDGGELFVVDFKRVPGESPAWVFEHVRAGDEAVIREIEQAGFVSLVVDRSSLNDSYVLRFRRAPPAH